MGDRGQHAFCYSQNGLEHAKFFANGADSGHEAGSPQGRSTGGVLNEERSFLRRVRPQSRGRFKQFRAWIESQIFVYNVTFGLYMLDWWERCIFNMLLLLLLWFVFYNGFHYALQCYEGTSLVYKSWSHTWYP
ncbi:hypothetical protein O6H91_02G152200 [Diphasiastrum complanatum]|uniref:Uncharacterized protein n=1 Tax=Diphasiastrum complanatum TaxID=34168 RepID=A0ACC2EM06_DIPCM|nr:hypothetical protein O6H91_02G152200 [Diphasiastrum complanatum]